MRRSLIIRRLMATTLPAAMVLGSVSSTAVAEPLIARNMSSFGMPGGIDTPTAEMLPDGTLGGTVSYSDYALRNNVTFQAMPRLTTALRYSRIDGINDHNDLGHIWDRSLDLRLLLLEQQGWRPAVAVGLMDFLGTGVHSGEYLVATKDITPQLRASVGLGWGALAGQPRSIDIRDEGGTPKVEDWFSGTPKPFASLNWQVNDRLSLVAEYSYNNYRASYTNGDTVWEIQQGEDEPGSNLNLGAYYSFGRSYQVGLYTIGGETIGAQFSFALNPRTAPYPSGLEKAPAPVRPRPSRTSDPEGWSGQWAADPTAQPAIQAALGDALMEEGIVLEGMVLTANRAEARIENQRYIQQAEAIGRTARLMTRALPPSVDTLVITSTPDGVPTSSVTLRRSDVERLENSPAGEIAAVAQISDAAPRPQGLVYSDELYPDFSWRLGPYLDLGLFDPDDPLRYEVGAELSGIWELVPGLVLTGRVRQGFFGNIDQRGPGIPPELNGGERGDHYTPEEYESDPSLETTPEGVPRVRSDTRMYTGNSSPTIPELTLAWYAKPTENVYTRVTAGLLERAYGGISAEVMWWPTSSPLALGVEVNRVRKRDFDSLFSFRDYEATTAFVSAYYQFAQGYSAELDIGQYLAGDKGATVTLAREFANGWRVGAYVTKTDLSAEEFGEGSYDKGIMLSLPLSWATGKPSRNRATTTIRSLSRDGGARVDVSGRLYDTLRDSHEVELYQGWGRFWR
ncbi:YjbH domain-containing protein [Paracoccus marinaquae]|uniref:YjbH domain-containing protein n=1 Tax=Paracoccus marinaquae TaxID=2841926 RepID=A0ABS6AI55_9RHOB|nr:YjbH domain-containing protein [Paracoccus marinaquae]MBU3030199.1 YjbH domain-containing protein [Paracoccus marinaquae]